MGITERKEREKEQRRDEIIDAAQKVFFEKGLQNATMDEIADRAELSKGTLYLYYKSKEDLYLAVAMRGSELMYQMFQAVATPEKSVLQAIVDLSDAYFEFFNTHRDFFRMYQYFENSQLHKQVSEGALDACKVKDQRVWNLVHGLIQRAIDEGLIEKDIDPVQASIILWATGNALMRQMDRDDTYWKEMGVNLEETMRRAYEFILTGMVTKKGLAMYKSIMKQKQLEKV